MAKIRRIIRKTKQPEPRFDDQFWPVALAVFVLGGFLLGTILSYLRFDDPRWYANAALWVAVVPVLVGVSLWGLYRVQSRVLRRGIQLSAILCVLVHLLLVIAALETYIFGRLQPAPVQLAAAEPPREPMIEPIYEVVVSDAQPPRSFERPVETETPDTPLPQLEPDPPEPEPQRPTEIQPTPTPEREVTVDPSVVRREQIAESAPRQAAHSSQLSRSVASTPPQPSQPVAIPQPASQPAASRPALASRDVALRQQPSEPQAERSVAAPEATVQNTTTTASRARPVDQPATPQTAAAPTLRRAVATPSSVPATQLDAAQELAAAERTRPEELRPANTAARRQATALARTETNAPQPPTETTTQVEPSASRRDAPAPAEPTFAQTPTPMTNQRPRLTNRPEAASVASAVSPASASSADPAASAAIEPAAQPVRRSTPALTAQADPAAAQLQATTAAAAAPSAAETQPTRRRVADAPMITQSSPPSDARSPAAIQPPVATAASLVASVSGTSEANPVEVAAAAAPIRRQSATGSAAASAEPIQGGPQAAPAAQFVSGSRASSSQLPAVTSPAAPALPGRSLAAAQVAASPTPVDRPALAESASSDPQTTPQPARAALTRSLSGLSGVGQSANLDRGVSAPETPTTVASGAARRAEATQQTPAGAALAPSAPALVRHSVAGADRPAASLQANTLSSAAASGAEQPAELTATASRTITRTEAAANPGAVTAASGEVQVDLGPARVIAGASASRAAGGGQPDVNPLAAESQQLARSRSGGITAPAIASQVAAAEAMAPPGSASAEPQPQGLASRLADLGRTAVAPADATGGALPAPAEVAGQISSGLLSSAAAGRAEHAAAVPQINQPAATGGENTERLRARQSGTTSFAGTPLTTAVDLTGIRSAEGDQPTVETEASTAAVARTTASDGAAAAESLAAFRAAELDAAGERAELAGAATGRRAEAVDAVAGEPVIGGGTQTPRRAALTRSIPSDLATAENLVAGAPESAGRQRGEPVDTLGPRPAELTTGRSGSPSDLPIGAVADAQVLQGVADRGAQTGLARMMRSASDEQGPSISHADVAAAPRRRSSPALPLSAAAGPAAEPAAAPSAVVLAQAEIEAGAGSETSPMTRQAVSTVSLDLPAVEGPAGLGSLPAADVGVNTRRARPESLQIQPQTTRFVRRDVGGLPDFNTGAVSSTEAFRRRSPASRPGPAGGTAPSAEADAAIELGLAYLARQQLPDGSWSLQASDANAALVSDTAATGLALLAFQGYGHTHFDNPYALVVRRGLNHLLTHQRADGDLFLPLDDDSNRSVWLYSHAIAAIALCEAYGMTQDPALREPAQKAIDFIVQSQHRENGGWRYSPNLEGDTSVTGWMMMALKSGELANLQVPTETYARIDKWLDLAQSSRSERHLYRYNPYAPDNDQQRHGRRPSKTMTAVGLLMRLYSGWRRDNEQMVRGAEYLRENLPSLGTPRNPQRDTYYWYYATQVMFHMGGDYWKEWNAQLRPLLVNAQVQSGAEAGSWNPRTPIADAWAPHAGRLYVTTMNLLSLEVHYRHLPLYVEAGR